MAWRAAATAITTQDAEHYVTTLDGLRIYASASHPTDTRWSGPRELLSQAHAPLLAESGEGLDLDTSVNWS